MAAALLRQLLDYSASLRPSPYAINYFISLTTHAFVRPKTLFLICYSLALDLILYLLHLYHVTQPTSVIGHI